MLNAEFIQKDNDWDKESTTYWFDINGETYGVVESGCDDPVIVDCDSCPVVLSDKKNIHLNDLAENVTEELRMA